MPGAAVKERRGAATKTNPEPTLFSLGDGPSNEPADQTNAVTTLESRQDGGGVGSAGKLGSDDSGRLTDSGFVMSGVGWGVKNRIRIGGLEVDDDIWPWEADLRAAEAGARRQSAVRPAEPDADADDEDAGSGEFRLETVGALVKEAIGEEYEQLSASGEHEQPTADAGREQSAVSVGRERLAVEAEYGRLTAGAEYERLAIAECEAARAAAERYARSRGPAVTTVEQEIDERSLSPLEELGEAFDEPAETPTGRPMPPLPARGQIAELGVARCGLAPRKIGRGRLVPVRLSWKPGDPFATPPKRKRRQFRWDVMLTSACITAACGLVCVWLLRTLLA